MALRHNRYAAKFWSQSTADSVSMSVNFIIEPVDNIAQIAWMRWSQSYWGFWGQLLGLLGYSCERIWGQYAFNSTPLLLGYWYWPVWALMWKGPNGTSTVLQGLYHLSLVSYFYCNAFVWHARITWLDKSSESVQVHSTLVHPRPCLLILNP